MKIEKKLLVPIEQENFKKAFIKSSTLQPYEAVLDYYKPRIESLERAAFNRHFWFVVDFVNWVNVDCGGELENLTPFKKTDFAGKDHSILHQVTHPEDLPKVFAYSHAYMNILENFSVDYVHQLRMSLYFRMKNAKLEYYWIMVQYPEAILDANGKIQYGLVFVTDISHIKNDGLPMMSIFDANTQKCQQFYCTEGDELKEETGAVPSVTNREKEVLSLVSRGLGSKQIADKLNIAVKTVENHRQNMLKKNNSKSCSELLMLAIKHGLLEV